MGEIEKSPIVLAQEKEIEGLEIKIKKAKTSIKSLKTRKKNVEIEFTERQSEVFNNTHRMLEELQRINQEVDDTLEQLAKDKRFSKEDRAIFVDFLKEFGEVQKDYGDFEDLRDQHNQKTAGNEEGRAQERQFFNAFAVETSKEEKRNIRSLYLQLSKEFHPDNIQDAQKKKSALALQQKIIQAYEANDYQALADIQALHSEAALLEVSEEDTDVLANKIKALNVQLEQLLAQKERLSAELKAFRKSEAGQILSATKSAERDGFSISDISGLSEIGEMVEEIKMLLEALKHTQEKGLITDDLEDILFPPADNPFEDMYFGDLEDFFSSEGEVNDHPKFPVGTLVEVSRNFTEIEEWDALFPIFGTIESAWLNGPDDSPEYNITIHTISLKALPRSFFLDQHEYEDAFNELVDVPEIYIKRADASIKADPPALRVSVTKKTWINAFLLEIEAKYKDQITEAILSQPAQNIVEAWKAYLNSHISFPQQVITKSSIDGLWIKGEKLRWASIQNLDDEDFPTMIRVEKTKQMYTIVPLQLVQSKDPALILLMECDHILNQIIDPPF